VKYLGKRKLTFWKVPVTPLLDEMLEKAIERNAHVTKSDFIREAVREKLAKMGFMASTEACIKEA
jgi:Arc/MetJ-type ribon-helix-helix transcriptional regulator